MLNCACSKIIGPKLNGGDEQPVLKLYKLVNLCINGVNRGQIGDEAFAVQQFINRRERQFVGMNKNAEIIQNAGKMLHTAQVTRAAGGHAGEQSLLSPPY